MTRAPLSRSDKAIVACLFAIPLVGNMHALSTGIYLAHETRMFGTDVGVLWLLGIALYTVIASSVFGAAAFLSRDDHPALVWCPMVGVLLSFTPWVTGTLAYTP